MTHDEFGLYHEEWEGRLSLYDRDLAQDLEQLGRCALWQLDLGNIRGDDRRYIWRMLRNTMIDELRRERRARIFVPRWRGDRRLAQCKVESALHTPKRRELHRRGAPRHYNAAPYYTDDRAVARAMPGVTVRKRVVALRIPAYHTR